MFRVLKPPSGKRGARNDARTRRNNLLHRDVARNLPLFLDGEPPMTREVKAIELLSAEERDALRK